MFSIISQSLSLGTERESAGCTGKWFRIVPLIMHRTAFQVHLFPLRGPGESHSASNLALPVMPRSVSSTDKPTSCKRLFTKTVGGSGSDSTTDSQSLSYMHPSPDLVRNSCLVDPNPMKTMIASIGTAGFRMILTPIDTAKTTLQTKGKGGMTSLKNRVGVWKWCLD